MFVIKTTVRAIQYTEVNILNDLFEVHFQTIPVMLSQFHKKIQGQYK